MSGHSETKASAPATQRVYFWRSACSCNDAAGKPKLYDQTILPRRSSVASSVASQPLAWRICSARNAQASSSDVGAEFESAGAAIRLALIAQNAVAQWRGMSENLASSVSQTREAHKY